MTLKVICSWCKKVIREGDAPADVPVTNGCCRACLRKYFPLYCEEVEDSIKEDEENLEENPS